VSDKLVNMKNVYIVIVCLLAVFSCKNDAKAEKLEDLTSDSEARTAKQSDGLTHLKGEFVYVDGAAVLQTHKEIYGVLITDRLEALQKQANAYKTEPTDMVLIEVRGKISQQKDDKILWPNKLEIVEILSVKPIPEEKDNVIKLEN